MTQRHRHLAILDGQIAWLTDDEAERAVREQDDETARNWHQRTNRLWVSTQGDNCKMYYRPPAPTSTDDNVDPRVKYLDTVFERVTQTKLQIEHELTQTWGKL